MLNIITGSGNYQRAADSKIEINGQIIAPGGITLDAETVQIGDGARLIASNQDALQASLAAVNVGQFSSEMVEKDGVIELIAKNVNLGAKDAAHQVASPTLIVNSGHEIKITAEDNITARENLVLSSRSTAIPAADASLTETIEQLRDGALAGSVGNISLTAPTVDLQKTATSTLTDKIRPHQLLVAM